MSLDFLFFFENFLKHSNKLKTPTILLSTNFFGLSIDLSTWVSAAKLKIPNGLNLLNILLTFVELFISHFMNL